MKIIESLLSIEVIEALGWTLLHSLWQGAALAIILAILLVLMHRFSSTTRYYITVFMLFLFLAISVSSFLIRYEPATVSSITIYNTTNTELIVSESPIFPNESEPNHSSLTTQPVFYFGNNAVSYFSKHLPLIVTIWLLGVVILLLRFLGSLGYVQRLKHHKTMPFSPPWQEKATSLKIKLKIRQKINFARSLIIPTPIAVGFFRPFVLMPAKLMTGLSEDQIEAILIHELAHIKRNDYAVNVLQSLVEILFFYHPAIWWMSSAIRHERENCCDDMAISLTGEATSYAKTLIMLKEKNMPSSIPAVAFSGLQNSFSHRIKRLFEQPRLFADFREGFATALILVAGIVLLSFSSPQWKAEPFVTADEQENFEQKEKSDQEDNLMVSSEKEDRSDEKENLINAKKEKKSPQTTPANKELELFLEAINDGDYELVAYMIKNDTNVNGKTREGKTPLMEAVDENNLKIVKLLVQNKADVNARDNRGYSVLMEAVEDASPEIVQYLLDNGASPNDRSREGWTLLMEAADEGNLEMIKLLLKNKADINAVDTRGNSVLMEAIGDAPFNVVAYLIENGADLKAKNRNGTTMLMEAINEGRIDVVKLLISKGADVNEESRDGTPLLEAINEGQPEIVQLLIDNGANMEAATRDGNTPLMEAVEEGQEEILISLLNKGLDVNKSNRNGYTPLMEAINEGNLRLVEILINKGANINQVTKNGHTPLLEAVDESHLDIVKLLLQKGININDLTGHSTPLAEAIDEGDLTMIQFLLENGADVNLARRNSYTPLMEAADEGQFEITKLLLAKGAKADAATSKGWTALFEAVGEEHIEIVRLLIEKGANVNQLATNNNQNIRMNYGVAMIIHEWTPLFEAIDEENIAIAEFLIKNGAKVDTRIKKSIRNMNTDETTLYQGWTTLMEAAQSGNLDMVKFLIDNGADPKAKTSQGLTAVDIAKMFGNNMKIE